MFLFSILYIFEDGHSFPANRLDSLWCILLTCIPCLRFALQLY